MFSGNNGFFSSQTPDSGYTSSQNQGGYSTSQTNPGQSTIYSNTGYSSIPTQSVTYSQGHRHRMFSNAVPSQTVTYADNDKPCCGFGYRHR